MPSVVDNIRHYQRSIEKSEQDVARILHCIQKLDNLPVNMEHLTVTKVGLTVNNLRRKFDGEVAVAARALVTKWKTMVAQEEEEEAAAASAAASGQDEHMAEDDEEETDEPNIEEEEEEEDIERLQIDEEQEEASESMALPTPPPKRESPERKKHSSKSRHKDRSREKSSHKSSSDSKSGNSSSHHSSSSHKSSNKHHNSSDSSKKKEGDKERQKEGHKKDHKKDKTREKPKESTSSSTSKSRNPDESASRSERKKEKSSDEEKSKKRKRDKEFIIDSSMGASFADAMGFLDMPSSSKKKHKLSKAVATTAASSSSTTSSGPLDNEVATTSKDESPLSLLSKKPRLDVLPDIAAEIPPLAPATISTNYRPMPLNPTVMNCVFKEPRQKPMTDEEAFGYSIQSKKERTKMFSGQKSSGPQTVPSLFDLCIKVIDAHIDNLEATGGIPYYILKPIIDKVSPEQLLRIEDYNPYLLESTDCHWEIFCKRHFSRIKPQSDETWREMYLRCVDEREDRLARLTNTLKKKKQEAVPEKQTKLAFVDSHIKAPRTIQAKQMRYGTDRLVVASPASRVQALQAATPNVARIGDTRLKVAAAIRDTIPSHAPKVNPNRKAPLMMKTMKSIKKCFKR